MDERRSATVTLQTESRVLVFTPQVVCPDVDYTGIVLPMKHTRAWCTEHACFITKKNNVRPDGQ